MPILAAFALANLKSDLAKLWSWLCHRSFWQLVSMALAAFAVVQHFQIADARHDASSYKKQRDDAQAELKRLSTVKNEQRIVTRDRIVIAERKVKDADTRAKKVEAAPLPGNCKTPPEIMGADL